MLDLLVVCEEAGMGLDAAVAKVTDPEIMGVATPLHKEMRRMHLPRPMLGADTVVVAHGEILGKPSDRADFVRMMGLLSGHAHLVMTAVALVDADGGEASRLSVNHVTFRHLSDAEVDAYWASGEPADKAGGYAIQGLAAIYIARVEGSYSGVMGLPLFETAELLRAGMVKD